MTELNPLDRIQELCDERNWSYYQLAKVSGIAYSTLSTMINKHNMPSYSAETLLRVRHLHYRLF